MPIGPTNTKAERAAVVSGEMHKFGKGQLHSGSKHGPVVTNPKQAVAIAMSESGQSKGKAPMAKDYDTTAHTGTYHGKDGKAMGAKGDQKPMEYSQKTNAEGASSQPVAGHEGLKGGSVGMAEHHGGTAHGGAPHRFPTAAGAQSFGHPAHLRSGAERRSGHSGAHRIGKK